MNANPHAKVTAMNSQPLPSSFLLLVLACSGPVHAADELPAANMEQPDAYRLRLQEQLQSMTPEERALFQSMNQLRASNQNRHSNENAAKGRGKKSGSRDGSGRKYRHGQNGARGKGMGQERF